MYNYADQSADFLIPDGLQPLVLRISGQPDQAIPRAINEPVTWKEADSAGGQVVESGAVWAWPMAATPIRPPLGAVLIDNRGNAWTILAIEEIDHVAEWHATTRNLSIAYELNNMATVLQAEYVQSPGGEALPSWRTILTGIPARFQPVRQEARILEDADWPKTTYEVILGLDIFAPQVPVEPVNADYRLVDTAGRHYRIVEYQRPARIDCLPRAVCVLIVEGSEGGASDRVSSGS
jgi:hypothetical protein